MGECLFPACVSSVFVDLICLHMFMLNPITLHSNANIQYINIKLLKQRYIISYIENVT